MRLNIIDTYFGLYFPFYLEKDNNTGKYNMKMNKILFDLIKNEKSSVMMDVDFLDSELAKHKQYYKNILYPLNKYYFEKNDNKVISTKEELFKNVENINDFLDYLNQLNFYIEDITKEDYLNFLDYYEKMYI